MNRVEFFKKTWVYVALLFIVMFAAFVSLLPVVIKYYAEDWYLSQGVKSVEIGDIDLNLFTGVMAVEAIQVKDDTDTVFSLAQATVNLSMMELFSKRILVESLGFREFSISVNRSTDKPVNIGGIAIGGVEDTSDESKEESTPAWGFGLVETNIERLVLNYQDNKISTTVSLRNATLNNALTWTPEETAVLRIDGEVNGSPVSINADIKPFANSPSAKGRLKLEDISVDEFSELTKPGLQGLSGQLIVDSSFDVNYSANKSFVLKTKGVYRLNNGDIRLTNHRIRSNGFNIEGAFELNQPLQKSDQRVAVSYFGDVSVDGISVDDSQKSILLAKAKRVSLTNGEINGLDAISVEKLAMEELASIHKQDEKIPRFANTLLRFALVNAENLKLNRLNDLSISKIGLTKVTGILAKNKNGKIFLLDEFGAKEEAIDKDKVPSQPATGKESSSQDQPDGFKFKIGTIEVSEKSKISFRDASVIPKFEANLQIKSLAISNIDNSRKENESRFSLTGKLDKYSVIEVNGKAKLFAHAQDFSLAANVKKYEMPHLSSYTSQVLGYDLVSGQGNVDLRMNRTGDKVDGEAKLKLHNLTVKETNPEHMKELNEQLSIPLSSALSMLRDKDDDIKLTIPITGKFLEPDVGIGDVINTALGKALRGSTLSYLKYTFQPYGTLISIVELAGSVTGSIQLDPVSFEAGENELEDDAIEYLFKVAEILQDRRKIRIKLCGISNEEDRFALNEVARQARKQPIDNDELFALAKKRAENVKEYLVDHFKVDPARLFVCHPEIKTDEKAQPSVELLI